MLMLSLPVDSPSVVRSVHTFLWWAVLQGAVIVMQNRCGVWLGAGGGWVVLQGAVVVVLNRCWLAGGMAAQLGPAN